MPRRRGRPPKPKPPTPTALPTAPPKRGPGRPKGSKNRPKSESGSAASPWKYRTTRKKARRRYVPPVRPPQPAPDPLEPWQRALASLRQLAEDDARIAAEAWPEGRRVLYVVDVQSSASRRDLSVDLARQSLLANGGWGAPQPLSVAFARAASLPDADDRRIVGMLKGGREHEGSYGSFSSTGASSTTRYRLAEPLQSEVVPAMCRTGRLALRGVDGVLDSTPLAWDAPPWELWLEIRWERRGRRYALAPSVRRGDERRTTDEFLLLAPGGLAFERGRVAPLDDGGLFDLVTQYRRTGPIHVPAERAGELLEELLRSPRSARIDLPEQLRVERVAPAPVPRLSIKAPGARSASQKVRAALSFHYDGLVVAMSRPGPGVYDAERRRMVLRDATAEAAASERLAAAGLRRSPYAYDGGPPLELSARQLPDLVRELIAENWIVEAEGKRYLKPGDMRVDVRSAVDWFELHGTVEYGDSYATIPALLAALRRGETTVRLGDGTFGLLPEAWLAKFGGLAGLGRVEGDHLRFSRSQAGLLDALLAEQPEASVDAGFARARRALRRFEGVTPVDPPRGFVGTLRPYQRDALGWFGFLRHFGFGGCLADDMGLGKTVVVLALLESRRAARARANSAERPVGPSLVVVPKSLVFNWVAEAAKFAPRLVVLDYTGPDRERLRKRFDEADVVLTTYGTLRRDAASFARRRFDYVVLDEAQAVKNPTTQQSKAARLLRGEHRLALSGTPIENHIGELWSLFEFLNPGMLGALSAFKTPGVGLASPDPEARAVLTRGLRPFVLRRTKAQVAKDLPARVEQTLHCELEGEQRKLYDGLRAYLRDELLGRIERVGVAKSKVQILTALLRLRQAACHPGLVAPRLLGEPSAKIEVLMTNLAEVLEEGHKALVFSQFTRFLAILRGRLDRAGIDYEYLDGRTRDRGSRVERFQTDPECKLFLISLKAGGVGLNLTAAEYVYLLDPWWNPAVEAQAIDRAHRIGQTRHVFAYRLIARDTVEEKILELQKAKRDLADAIITADDSLIRTIAAEDVRLLLS